MEYTFRKTDLEQQTYTDVEEKEVKREDNKIQLEEEGERTGTSWEKGDLCPIFFGK